MVEHEESLLPFISQQTCTLLCLRDPRIQIADTLVKYAVLWGQSDYSAQPLVYFQSFI